MTTAIAEFEVDCREAAQTYIKTADERIAECAKREADDFAADLHRMTESHLVYWLDHYTRQRNNADQVVRAQKSALRRNHWSYSGLAFMANRQQAASARAILAVIEPRLAELEAA